jgi:AraC-like DNA-binding protein
MIKSTVQTFDDPEDFQKSIRNAEVRIFVSGRGEYQAELARIDLPKMWMQRLRQSLPTLAHATMAKTRAAILFLSDAQQPALTYSGIEVSSSCVVSAALSDEYYIRFPADATLSACSLTPAELASSGRTLTGRELYAPAAGRVLRPNANHIARLRSVHGAAVSLAANTPDILAHPEVGRAVEQALIAATVACLADADNGDMTRVSQAGGRVMRRLEELLEAKQDEPLYIPEICAEAGIGGRTLRAYCQENLGMSPHSYLRLRRMNAVRHALMRANAKTATVTDIATQYGFGELGRFAVSYRALFGESPSATLHRQRDTHPPPAAEHSRQDSIFA